MSTSSRSMPPVSAPPGLPAPPAPPGSQIRLDRFVDDVERLGSGPLDAWRGAALAGLTDVRHFLVDERVCPWRWDGEGSIGLLCEHSDLLDRVGALRLQVLGLEEVDRLLYDVRRLVADVRTHLEHLPDPAPGAAPGEAPGASRPVTN